MVQLICGVLWRDDQCFAEGFQAIAVVNSFIVSRAITTNNQRLHIGLITIGLYWSDKNLNWEPHKGPRYETCKYRYWNSSYLNCDGWNARLTDV